MRTFYITYELRGLIYHTDVKDVTWLVALPKFKAKFSPRDRDRLIIKKVTLK